MTMSKKKVLLEYELRSGSPSIVWPLVSEASGLSRWMADEVEREGKKLVFTWGTSWQSKDVRTATIVEEVKPKRIRFKWDGDEDTQAYCEMKIEKGDITNDCILVITDFAEDGDVDGLRDLWDANMEVLHQVSGL